jgi:hypothetical protein
MLASPEGWYLAVPGVTTTGPFNQHFVRDIGLIFLFVGTLYAAGAMRRHDRVYCGRLLLCGSPAMRCSISGR